MTAVLPDDLRRGDVVPGAFGGVVDRVERYGGPDHPTGHHPLIASIDRRIVFTDGRMMSAESLRPIDAATSSSGVARTG